MIYSNNSKHTQCIRLVIQPHMYTMHVLAQTVNSHDKSTQAIPRKAPAQSAISAAQTLQRSQSRLFDSKRGEKTRRPIHGPLHKLLASHYFLENTRILIMQRPVKRQVAILANSATLHVYNKLTINSGVGSTIGPWEADVMLWQQRRVERGSGQVRSGRAVSGGA